MSASSIEQTPFLTLALPAYNEEGNITSVLDASISALQRLGKTWEIIVVDNYSSDRTPKVVEEYIKTEPRVRLIRHPENRLYSGSCATAIREGRGTLLAIMDSDGQFSAEDLDGLMSKIEAGFNLVFGWRRRRYDPVSRKLMSKVFNALGAIWLRYPFHDLNCGIRIFDRNMLSVAHINHRINMVNPELYVRAVNANLRVGEVVVRHAERRQGNTSHDFKKLWHLLLQINTYFRTLSKEMRKVVPESRCETEHTR